MTSDFSKMFGNVSYVPQREEGTLVDPSTIEVAPNDKVGSTRKKITRIPLFGRTRKLSTSSNLTSTDASRPSNSEPARRPSLPSLSVPTPSSSKNTTSSFSKFAAHFSPSQSKLNLHLDSLTSSSRTSLTPAPVSSLMPPNVRPSYESGSSNATKTRSTTPRGVHPVIMVSDNLEEFKDLFTQELPTQKVASKSKDLNPSQASEPASFRRGQTPASALAAAVREQAHERQPRASSNSVHTITDLVKGSNEKIDGSTTPKLLDVRDKIEGPALRPSTGTGVGGSSSVQSRMRPLSAGSRTKPPSIPLPDVPTRSSDGVSLKVDAALSVMDGRTPEANRTIRRPRTSTISSIPDLTSISLPASSIRDRRGSKIVDPPNVADIEDIDIDIALPEQLRRALRFRNRKFEELTSYMLRMEEGWEAERKSFEKKISALQRDLGRRESEITGLKLIINEEKRSGRPKPLPIPPGSRLSPVSTSAQSDQEGSAQSHTSGSNRVNYLSDSGVESPLGSGNDSSSSVRRLKKMHHRSSAIAVGSNSDGYASRSGSTMRLPKTSTQPSQEKAPESPFTRRMSLLSISSSGSSSGTSSLMPPSPSVTMSSLSAIPEGSRPEASIRASRRISASSVTSSSTAASSVYSINIKRSRPPSIAQVLEKSPNLDGVLEQLRPFAS